jgi:shikimate dehydrogenase
MKVEYQNSTGLLAVIGDPIGHSLSPLLQNTMLEALGEDYLYLALRVQAGQLSEFVAAAKTLGLRGFNLTMPHKEDILPFLAERTPEAARCGSVNSVRLRDGKLEGHSTDGLGFRRSIADFGWDFPDKRVTLLGAGGAAKSIAMTAVDSGAAVVRVVNRTLSKAERLCAGEKTMEALPQTALEAVLPQTDILINTTPIGMAGVGGSGIPDLSALNPAALCMDCIYAPAMTPFMEEARKYGHPSGNGIGMLVYQAIFALEFFLDRSFSPETVDDLGKRLLKVSGVDPKGE